MTTTPQSNPQNPAVSAERPRSPTSPAGRVLRVVRDAVLIFLSTFVAGFLLGFVATATGNEGLLAWTPVTDVLITVVGLWLAAAHGPRGHWTHLLYVSAVLWLLTAVNLLLGSPISVLLVSGAIIVGSAVAAGVVVQLTRRSA